MIKIKLVDESSSYSMIYFSSTVGSNITSKDEERNETEIFIRFEETLRKYLENSDHFTVEPRLVYADVDLKSLNEFLLRDRPGDISTSFMTLRFEFFSHHFYSC
jgi:hypothetical protein